MTAELQQAVTAAESALADAVRLRTNLQHQADEAAGEAARLLHTLEEAKRKLAAATPVDRTKVECIGGSDPSDPAHKQHRANGQQIDYVVLSAEERAKGFVRPVRDAYRHAPCGAVTTMSRVLAETYARDPFFYNGTFCSTCRAHFDVGEDGLFTWLESDGREIHKVGT